MSKTVSTAAGPRNERLALLAEWLWLEANIRKFAEETYESMRDREYPEPCLASEMKKLVAEYMARRPPGPCPATIEPDNA
jgi:hypothetical protein